METSDNSTSQGIQSDFTLLAQDPIYSTSHYLHLKQTPFAVALPLPLLLPPENQAMIPTVMPAKHVQSLPSTGY